jgi:glycosyltransferase involved in cell wall biosynthesis
MNRQDPQMGVFIRKHASAVALYCDVTLLCVMGDSDQKNPLEIEEKNEYGIWSVVAYFKKFNSPVSIFNAIINTFRYLEANRKALQYIEQKKGRHDITHAYILLRPAIIAWMLKIFRGIPFVISEQWSGYATGMFAKKNFVKKSLSRILFRKASAVTAVSNFLKEKMEASGLHNQYTITPNVVEPVEKKTSPLPSNNSIKILSVADLVDKIKNISATIEAVTEISKQNDNIEFHIVGHGKDEKVLKDLAIKLGVLDKFVFFHGVKTNEEVFQFLHACDFLVMNSYFETFSLICIEAMSCGKPVIATDCGGPSGFMQPEYGIMISPGDTGQLKSALEKMISDFKNYNSEVLKEFALTNFSASETGKKFAEIYGQVLAG